MQATNYPQRSNSTAQKLKYQPETISLLAIEVPMNRAKFALPKVPRQQVKLAILEEERQRQN